MRSFRNLRKPLSTGALHIAVPMGPNPLRFPQFFFRKIRNTHRWIQ